MLRRLAARLPDAYRLIPHAGRTIDKPMLRLAAAHRLPPDVRRHYGRTWLGAPDEAWCLRHPDALARLLADPDARLTALGVVDPHRLDEVADPPRTSAATPRTGSVPRWSNWSWAIWSHTRKETAAMPLLRLTDQTSLDPADGTGLLLDGAEDRHYELNPVATGERIDAGDAVLREGLTTLAGRLTENRLAEPEGGAPT